MAVSRDVRRVRFGTLVGRALTDARAHGMTIRQIEQATKVSKTTFYRWKDGDWTKDPRATEVRDFCVGLGIPVEVAFQALGWLGEDRAPPEPLTNPDLLALARKLEDPSTSEAERYHIAETIRSLARRGDESARRDRPAG